MDSNFVPATRQSLHQINNDLAIASMSLELIKIRLDNPENQLDRDELIKSCSAAIEAVQRAGKRANETLHQMHTDESDDDL